MSQTTTTAPQLWTPDQVAEFLQISTNELSQLRHAGTGPLYMKFGRKVRYNPRRVHEWVEANTRAGTKD